VAHAQDRFIILENTSIWNRKGTSIICALRTATSGFP
jgi:hypothetical protein